MDAGVFALMDHMNVAVPQRGVHGLDDVFVARDDLRTEDDGVSGVEQHVSVVVRGQAVERAAGFSLGARAEEQHPLWWEVAGLVRRHEGRDVAEVARTLGGLDHALQRASQQDRVATVGIGDARDGLDACHVAGEGADGPACGLADEAVEVVVDVGFGTGRQSTSRWWSR